MFFTWLILALDGLFAANDPHANDLHWDQNNYLNGFLSYALQANHFFPIDTYLAITMIYFSIYAFLLVMKVFEVGANFVRGSGVRL